MYWDLFDMKQRELDEYAEVCAKESEQEKESEELQEILEEIRY